MKIGVDIDSVTCDLMTPLMARINKKYGTNISENDVTKWYWDITAEGRDGPVKIVGVDEIREALSDENFILNCPMVPGAKSCLAALEMMYGKENVIFITARREETAGENTRKWLTDKVGDHSVIFAGGRKKNGFGIDVLVDDAPHTIQSFMENHTKVVGILYNRAWNQNYNVDVKKDTWRAYSWDNVVDIIDLYDVLKYFEKDFVPKRFRIFGGKK